MDISNLTEAHLGAPAVLACLATGFPIPSISWRKNGEEVNIYRSSTLNSSRITEYNLTTGSVFQSKGEILLMMYTNFKVDHMIQLGELEVVGLLSFDQTIRRDTANYTCNASNHFMRTQTLTSVSNIIPLIILGEFMDYVGT